MTRQSYRHPPSCAKYFLIRFTLISKMTKFDLSGADFSPRAEKLEPCCKDDVGCFQSIFFLLLRALSLYSMFDESSNKMKLAPTRKKCNLTLA